MWRACQSRAPGPQTRCKGAGPLLWWQQPVNAMGCIDRCLCRDTDLLLTELAAAMPVDVMPGASEPANHSLPQQPLHRCLFPGACSFTSFNRCVLCVWVAVCVVMSGWVYVSACAIRHHRPQAVDNRIFASM